MTLQQLGFGGIHDSWMSFEGHFHAQPQFDITQVDHSPEYDFPRSPSSWDTAYSSMPRPPPYTPRQPYILTNLNESPEHKAWPSMLTTQLSRPVSILPATAVHTEVSADTASAVSPPTITKLMPKRKLTDDDRRQMCLEAEKNPDMKQTQIGVKFSVERITVSKILRQKEKYLNPESKEVIPRPAKKTKTKIPDFNKTLVTWVHKQQEKGLPVNDVELLQQARIFSINQSDRELLERSEWLGDFKKRNGIRRCTRKTKSNKPKPTLHVDTPIARILEFATSPLVPPSSSANCLSRSPSSEDDRAEEFHDDVTKESGDEFIEVYGGLTGPRDNMPRCISPALGGGGSPTPHTVLDDEILPHDLSLIQTLAMSFHDDGTILLEKLTKILQKYPDIVEPDDYVMIGKLTERLKISQKLTLSLSTRSPKNG